MLVDYPPKQNNIERVLIAYDRDEAGNRAAEKLAKQLIESGIDCYRIQFPKGMDVNSYAVQGCTSVAGGRKPGETALQVQPANKSLGVVIRSAVWLGKGKAQTITTANPAQQENTTTKQAAKNKKTTKPLALKAKTVLEPEAKNQPIPSLAAEPENEEEKEHRVRGSCSSRLPTEPCVRVRTRLLTQDVSIEKLQTNALTFGRIVFPALSD